MATPQCVPQDCYGPAGLEGPPMQEASVEWASRDDQDAFPDTDDEFDGPSSRLGRWSCANATHIVSRAIGVLPCAAGAFAPGVVSSPISGVPCAVGAFPCSPWDGSELAPLVMLAEEGPGSERPALQAAGASWCAMPKMAPEEGRGTAPPLLQAGVAVPGAADVEHAGEALSLWPARRSASSMSSGRGSVASMWSECSLAASTEAASSRGSTRPPSSPERAVAEPQTHGGAMWSLHAAGACRPCPWLWRAGCSNGEACRHCHFCPAEAESEYRRAKTLRRKRLRRSSGGSPVGERACELE